MRPRVPVETTPAEVVTQPDGRVTFANGERVRIVAEGAKRTYFEVISRAKKGGGPSVTVSVGRQGKYYCHTCGSIFCYHGSDAQEFMSRQKAEPAALPAIPLPTEGYNGHR